MSDKILVTGAAAIFSGRLLNNHFPVIFEDGLQYRNFIHVKDVARANLMTLQNPVTDGKVYNVDTGRQLTIFDLVKALTEHLNLNIELEIMGQMSEGDIRHCYGDVSLIQRELGFEDGVAELVQ